MNGMGWSMVVMAGLAIAGCAVQEAAAPEDIARGREVFVSREQGHCVLCHSVPGVAQAGDVGPSLAGVGTRLTRSQIRYRVEDITRVNAAAAMPAFGKVEGLARVAPAHAGRAILSAAQLDDVAGYLASLK